MGSSVTDIVSSGFIDDNYFKNNPEALQLGTLASLLGARPGGVVLVDISTALGHLSICPLLVHMTILRQDDSLGFKGIIAGLFMAWGIGADYVTNSFATSVGSKALILRQTVAIATVYEFVGRISMSASVTALQLTMLASLLGARPGGAVLADSPLLSGFIGASVFFLVRMTILRSPHAVSRGNYQGGPSLDQGLIMLGFTGIIAGLFMAWGIGANYVANSFATSVGSKALILRQAVAIATVYEFAGCISMGASVTDTVCSNFMDENYFKTTQMCCSWGRWPRLVALSWLTSPLLSGIIEASVFLLARMTILRSPHAVSRDHWQGETFFGSRVVIVVAACGPPGPQG
ncbi:unnamed protein product [Polarella glacialis]|uniref:Uncharacterized protein n=1 Tax=Polarella glacialis TaxID=89957 RepID=A0A813I7B8_POLGL|nr:unnamed protein product [Polarella glacialis]